MEPTKEPEPKGQLRALLIEDDKSVLPLIRMAVGMAGGIKTEDTVSTVEALKILRTAKQQGQRFDLIFSDLGLVDDAEGGFKLAAAAKEEGLAEYFILYTGRAAAIGADKTPEELQTELKKKGIDQLIQKPPPGGIQDLKNSFNKAKAAIANIAPATNQQ